MPIRDSADRQLGDAVPVDIPVRLVAPDDEVVRIFRPAEPSTKTRGQCISSMAGNDVQSADDHDHALKPASLRS